MTGRRPMGEFQNSGSPDGTFDQGGNVWEWNEVVPYSSYRGFRGGAFYHDDYYLEASTKRDGYSPSYDNSGFLGFRVCEVPEPTSMAILAVSGLGMPVGRKRVEQYVPLRKVPDTFDLELCTDGCA